MIECVGLALLRIAIRYILRLMITYACGGRVLGLVHLALDCQQAHRQG